MSGTLIPILSLLIVVFLGFLITRVAAVALVFTGLAEDLARFQARSAYLGVGFTTAEAERIMEHPVRRRIILWMMWLGNAGFVATISSVAPLFVTSAEEPGDFLRKVAILSLGLFVLWGVASSTWIDRQMSRVIAWALRRWTKLDVRDYHGLLQLSSGYAVSEVKVDSGDWVTGKTLMQIRLGDEGIQVLGIRRATGEYVGAPRGTTVVLDGDILILYGRAEHLAELDNRHADVTGERAHARRVEEMSQTLLLQEEEGRALREEIMRSGGHGEPPRGK